MPLDKEKKEQTRERLNRDPDFRDEFLTKARNMYVKALASKPDLEDEINAFEKIMGTEPNTYEFSKGEMDEMDIFEQILNAYDSQILLEEKENSTIN